MPDGKCGAKTRTGKACKGIAMPNGRCRMHGGASTGAPPNNSNAVKHGFYSSALLPEERELMEHAQIGGIDDEIKLAKVKLHRLVRLSGSSELEGIVDDALEVIRKKGVDNQGAAFDRMEIKTTAANYAELIIKQLGIIGKLELTRMHLRLAEKKLDEDAPDGSAIDGFEVHEYDADT